MDLSGNGRRMDSNDLRHLGVEMIETCKHKFMFLYNKYRHTGVNVGYLNTIQFIEAHANATM